MRVISCAMQEKFHSFHPVAALLSYLTKAPLVITGPLPLLLASLLVIKKKSANLCIPGLECESFCQAVLVELESCTAVTIPSQMV
jgi:hypothetical protein